MTYRQFYAAFALAQPAVLGPKDAVSTAEAMCELLGVEPNDLIWPTTIALPPFSTPVENLWKTCEKPVDTIVAIPGQNPASPVSPVQAGLDPEPVRTSTRAGSHALFLNDDKTPEGPRLRHITPQEFDRLGRSPFVTDNLPAPQRIAIAFLVAFWRLRAAAGLPLSMKFDEFREELHNALGHLLHPEGNPNPSDVWAEAWSPAFWRSRPELLIGQLTVAPAPSILEGK